LLIFSRALAISNAAPDISYLSEYQQTKINGIDCFCWDTPTTKQIGIDLLQYTALWEQYELMKKTLNISTNIIRNDDEAFKLYEKEIKKTRGRAVLIGAGAGIVAFFLGFLIGSR
jgi:hypothetical protein